jgi:hypothetical protein
VSTTSALAFEQGLAEHAHSLLANTSKLGSDEERAAALVSYLSRSSIASKHLWIILLDNLTPACSSPLLNQLWALPFGSIIVTSKSVVSLPPALDADCHRLVLSRLEPKPAMDIVLSSYKGRSQITQSGSDALGAFVSEQLQCIPLKCQLARAVFQSITARALEHANKGSGPAVSADELVKELVSTFKTKCFNKPILRGGAQDYTQDRRLASMVELLVTDTLPACCIARARGDAAVAAALESDTTELLLMMCYTAPERGLPVKMFTAAAAREKWAKSRRLLQDQQSLESAMQLLEQVGLVSSETRASAAWGQSPWLRIHDSVQRCVSELLRQQAQFRGVLKLMEATGVFLYKLGPRTYADAEPILRSSLLIEETLGVSLDVAQSLNNVANLLFDRGPQHYAEADKLYRRSLSIRETLHSDVAGVHRDVAQSLNNLANLLRIRGPQYYAEADKLYRRSLSIRETLHSDVAGTHQDVAKSLNNVANLLSDRGPQHYAEADKLYRRSLSISETLHSDVAGVHQDVAQSLNNLALLLKARGPQHYAEADKLYRRSLSISETLHSDVAGVHQDVAQSLNNLAVLSKARGHQYYAEADKLYRRSLSINETLHSDVAGVHQDVAQSLNNLANLLRIRGPQYYAEADKLYRRSLSIRETLHSDVAGVHRDVAQSLNNLANLLIDGGSQHYAEADKLYRRSLSIRETLHSDIAGVHRDVAQSLNNLANLLSDRGPQHYAEADKLYRRSQSIRETLHSDVAGVHQDVAQSLNNLALLLSDRGPRTTRKLTNCIVDR